VDAVRSSAAAQRTTSGSDATGGTDRTLPTVVFLQIADWGCKPNKDGSPNFGQLQVALAMKQYDPDFVLALGDNFYENGVSSVTDSNWQQAFENVYTSSSMQKRWMVIVGNHDWRAGPKGINAQIDYTRAEGQNRWYMPASYYQEKIKIDAKTMLHFVFIDTTKLIGDSDGNFDEQQLSWIEKTLSESTAAWLFVCGHHPVRSAGDHHDNPQLMSRLKPLLDSYKVDAYLTGHDHVLQVIETDPTVHVCTGSGCKLGTMQDSPPDLKYSAVKRGFALHEVNREAYRLSMITHTGKVEKQFVYKRKRLL